MIGRLPESNQEKNKRTETPVVNGHALKAFWYEGAYSFWHYRVGKFSGTVGWDSTKNGDGFKVQFENYTLVKRYKDLNEAKAACEQLAKQVLEDALAAVLAKMNL